MKTIFFKTTFYCLLTVFYVKKGATQTIIGKPPDYGQIALHLPNCTATRPSSSVFSLEIALVWKQTAEIQPVLTTRYGYHKLSVADGGRLQWSFRPRKGNLNALFETVDTPLADGKRHIVQLIHGAKDCVFLIDERPVKGRWVDSIAPSSIRRDTGEWYVGTSVEGDFFTGYIQNFRLFDTDVRTFLNNKNDVKRDSAAAKKLLFDFWLDDWNPTTDAENSVTLDSHIRPDEPCGWASIIRKQGVELLPSKRRELSKVIEGEDKADRSVSKLLGGVLITMIVLAMVVMIYAGQSSEKKTGVSVGENQNLLLEEVPAELVRLFEKEKIGFVIRNSSPLPWSQLMTLAATMIGVVFLFREKWFDGFEKAMADDAAAQINGTLQLLGLSLGTAAALIAWMWKAGLPVCVLFGGRSYYIGTADRLLLVEPTSGLFRPIFWEQIRLAEKMPDGTIRLELRTLAFDQKFETSIPETLFLNGFNGNAFDVLRFIEGQMKVFSIPKSGPEAHINFGSSEADHYPRAGFSVLFAYEHTVFAVKGPFGQKPFLLLRSRIKKAIVEPYDLPKSGWLLVAELKSGVRQPIAFFPELQFAQSAATFLNQ